MARTNTLLTGFFVLLGTLLLTSSAGAESSDPLTAFNQALEQLVKKVAPAVVQVNASGPPQRTPEDSEDDDSDTYQVALDPQRIVGSGFIVDARGYIITNAHVLRGTSEIKVTLENPAPSQGSRKNTVAAKTFPAKLIGEFKEADLAVIKIDAEHLPTIGFARHDSLRQGQLVIAFGSPEGFQNSVSIGVISAIARQTNPDNHISYLQTDAAINPGSSGGPLVDINGNLVGVNAFLISQGGGSEGLGFAIPGDIAQFAFENIVKDGSVNWGDIGLRVQGITPTLAEGLHLPRDSGVVVSDVVPGTPAEVEGVSVGDVITGLDEKQLESVPEFYEALYHKRAGEKLALSITRHGRIVTVHLPVTAAGAEQFESSEESVPTSSVVSKLGILCSEIGSRPAPQIATLRSRTGLLVEAKAATTDLQVSLAVGDVIRAVNLTPVSSVAELQSFLDKMKPGTPLVLQVERKARFIYLPVNAD